MQVPLSPESGRWRICRADTDYSSCVFTFLYWIKGGGSQVRALEYLSGTPGKFRGVMKTSLLILSQSEGLVFPGCTMFCEIVFRCKNFSALNLSSLRPSNEHWLSEALPMWFLCVFYVDNSQFCEAGRQEVHHIIIGNICQWCLWWWFLIILSTPEMGLPWFQEKQNFEKPDITFSRHFSHCNASRLCSSVNKISAAALSIIRIKIHESASTCMFGRESFIS